MRFRRFLFLLTVSLVSVSCTPRLQGSYTVQPTVFNPDNVTLTFMGSHFSSCYGGVNYDGVNTGKKGSGTFTLRRGILTLNYGLTPTYIPGPDSVAVHLRSYNFRVPAGTVERYQYAPAKVGQQKGFRLAVIPLPVDTAVINYKLSLGVPAEGLKISEPEILFWSPISAAEAAGCLRK